MDWKVLTIEIHFFNVILITQEKIMFGCGNKAFKYLQVIACNPIEIGTLLINLQQYGVYLTVDELLKMGWQDSLKTLVTRLRTKYREEFESIFEKEKSNIIKAMSLVKECEFEDYNPRNVVQCLKECGVHGEKYTQLVYTGFR